MIKKLLYSLGVTATCLFTSISANAQCTPDANLTEPGVYPASFTSVCVNSPVDQTLQVVIPSNANQIPEIGLPVAVDSAIVTKVENVPAGMTHTCAAPNCKIIITDPTKPVNTCISFAGNPTETFDGNLIVHVTFYTSLGIVTQKHDIPFKVLAETDAQCLATNTVNIASENGVNIYPNPSNGVSTIDLTVADNSEVEVVVYNAIGNVSAVVFSGTTSSTSLTTPELGQGIYFVQVIVNGEATVEKLIVE